MRISSTFTRSFAISFLASALVAGFVTGCGDSPEAAKAKKEAGEAIDAVGDYFGKTKEDLMSGLKSSLAEYEDDIQRLKEGAKEKGSELSAETKELIQNLEGKAASAKDSLSKLNDNKGEVMDSLITGAKSSLAELKKAIREAKEAGSK